MKKRTFKTYRRFLVLLFACGSFLAIDVCASENYENLVELYKEWREFERPPIDAHFGRGQEHTLRVGHGDIVEDHLAIERTFDAPDIDLHPVLEF